MIARILTTATLMAGGALFCLPAPAQTGTTATTTINSGGASPTGSVGTTSNTPRNNGSMAPMGGGNTNSPGMGSSGTMSSQGGSNAQGGMQSSGSQTNSGGMGYQAQAGSHHMGGNAGERQMTECLNNAASQHQPLSTCNR